MSIADKLQAIAENEQKVYNAGKIALLKASRHMNATVSGTVVSVNDVSPVEHDVAVRLSSESVTDLSAVTVKRYGKNLLPYPYPRSTTTAGGVTFTDNGDGSVTMSGTATAVAVFSLHGNGVGTNATTLPAVFTAGEKYVFSAGQTLPTGVSIGNYFYDEDGVAFAGAGGGAHVNEGRSYNVYTVVKKNARLYSHIRIAKGTVLDNFTIYPMIEKGTTATAYEPYVEPTTYTASAGGTVTGVKSLSPVMTLVSDTDDVSVDCSYLRDIDTYIDNVTGGV